MAGMTDENIARLIYLLLFLVLVGGSMFSYRNRLSTAVKHAMIWIGIFALIVFGYAYRTPLLSLAGPVLSELNPSRPFEVTDQDGVRSLILTRSDNGHFKVTGKVDNVSVTFLVDTGASSTVLTFADAQRVGLQPEKLTFNKQVQTANGIATEAVVRVSRFEIGPFNVRNMPVGIAEDGKLPINLLGLDILNRFPSWKVEGDRLILTPDL